MGTADRWPPPEPRWPLSVDSRAVLVLTRLVSDVAANDVMARGEPGWLLLGRWARLDSLTPWTSEAICPHMQNGRTLVQRPHGKRPHVSSAKVCTSGHGLIATAHTYIRLYMRQGMAGHGCPHLGPGTEAGGHGVTPSILKMT